MYAFGNLWRLLNQALSCHIFAFSNWFYNLHSTTTLLESNCTHQSPLKGFHCILDPIHTTGGIALVIGVGRNAPVL